MCEKQVCLHETRIERELSKIELAYARIEACPHLVWGNLHCKTCDTRLTMKSFKLSCLSNFCKEVECVKNRLRIRRMQFDDLGIHSKKLYNFVIGFKDVSSKDFSKSLRAQYSKVVKYVLKEMLKVYGSFFYIAERDINLSSRRDGRLRYHYHIATLPLKDFRLFNRMLEFVCSKASVRFSLALMPSYSGYQKTSSVLAYFAKRSIGVFGHDRKDESRFGFVDVMNFEQYYRVFYKTKSWFTNLKYRARQRSEFIRVLNNIPQKCPCCGILTRNNLIFKECEAQSCVAPPPPNTEEELFIEIVKFS